MKIDNSPIHRRAPDAAVEGKNDLQKIHHSSWESKPLNKYKYRGARTSDPGWLDANIHAHVKRWETKRTSETLRRVDGLAHRNRLALVPWLPGSIADSMLLSEITPPRPKVIVRAKSLL